MKMKMKITRKQQHGKKQQGGGGGGGSFRKPVAPYNRGSNVELTVMNPSIPPAVAAAPPPLVASPVNSSNPSIPPAVKAAVDAGMSAAAINSDQMSKTPVLGKTLGYFLSGFFNKSSTPINSLWVLLLDDADAHAVHHIFEFSFKNDENLKGLTKLRFTGSDIRNKEIRETIIFILSNLTTLEKLDLSNITIESENHTIESENQLIELLQKIPSNLSELNLGNVPLQDWSVMNPLFALKNLTHLTLNNCHIAPAILKFIMLSFKNLQTLDVGNNNLKDNATTMIPLLPFGTLTSLSLSKCNLSDTDIGTLTTNLPRFSKLTTLRLDDTKIYTTLLQALPYSLRELTLNNSTIVGEVDEKIISKLRSIPTLDMTNIHPEETLRDYLKTKLFNDSNIFKLTPAKEDI